MLATGKYVFWHSTAHVLGEAMERVYGGCLCYGPPIEEGFYYDMHLEDGQVRSGGRRSRVRRRAHFVATHYLLEHGVYLIKGLPELSLLRLFCEL